VQLTTDILSNDLTQPPLVGCMNVLVVFADNKAVGCPFLFNLRQTFLDGGELILGQDAIVEVCTRKSDTTGYILSIEEAIVRQRSIVLLHNRVKAL